MYKIKARTAWDCVEIGPFNTRKDAEKEIKYQYNRGNLNYNNDLIVEYYDTIADEIKKAKGIKNFIS